MKRLMERENRVSPALPAVTGPQGGWNQRKTMLLLMALSVALLAAVTVAGQALEQQALVTDFSRKTCRRPWHTHLVRISWGGICLCER